jgi:hypothetical protein
MKFLVKLHKVHSENTLPYSVLLCLDPLIPPRWHCTDHQQHLLSLFLSPVGWQKQSGNIRCGTYISLLLGFEIPDTIVKLYLGLSAQCILVTPSLQECVTRGGV